MAVLHTNGTASHNPRCLGEMSCSHLQGHMHTTYANLRELFGEPDCIDQETSWVVRVEKLHELASVKTAIPENQLATTPDATINWDIGGFVPDVVASITGGRHPTLTGPTLHRTQGAIPCP